MESIVYRLYKANSSFLMPFSLVFPSLTTVHLNNVINSGITNGIAYVSAELSLFSIDFALVNKQSSELCYFVEEMEQQEGNEGYNNDANQYNNNNYQGVDNYYENNNNNENNGNRRLDQYGQCPNNGSYPYKIQYVLPSAGKESASWMASGWTGTGIIEMYAQRNDNMKIGECKLSLATFVTKQNKESLLNTPSAAATAGIALAVIFATLLMCMYCYCCIRSRKTKKDRLEAGDDVTSSFRRLDDDDNHSKPPTISVDAQSQATSKKSANKDIV